MASLYLDGVKIASYVLSHKLDSVKIDDADDKGRPRMLFGFDWEGWFSIAGALAMAGWAILILAPRRWGALNALPFYALPAVLSGGYAVLILLHFADAPSPRTASIVSTILVRWLVQEVHGWTNKSLLGCLRSYPWA